MNAPLPGAHGGDGHRVAAALGLDPATVLDLSASLNPFAPDPTEIVGRHLRALHAYPDANAATEQLAEALGVPSKRLVLTNGGAEAIALTARHLRQGHVVDPEFSLYRRHLAAVSPAAGRWRSNPTSPLGTLAGDQETAEVWDEAFYPLATGTWTRGDDAAWRLGSLTKLWSCPGLRLGFVIAPNTHQADAIRADQPRWSVNGIALDAVADFLSATDLAGWAQSIRRLRTDFTAALRGLGLTVVPSEANWVLVHAVPTLRALLAVHGIVVRDCTSFGLPGTVRIALPNPTDVDRVISAVAMSLT